MALAKPVASCVANVLAANADCKKLFSRSEMPAVASKLGKLHKPMRALDRTKIVGRQSAISKVLHTTTAT